jgi:hypothetical protein
VGSLIVDKRTLQILIRSADQTRKDLMGFNLGLQEKGLPSPEGFAGKVRDVRKIHDFLGRAGRGNEDTFSLDFAFKERILLGSCLHHLKAQVDADLRALDASKQQLCGLETIRSKINFLIAKMHAPGVSMLIKNGELTLNHARDLDPDLAALDIDLTEGDCSADLSKGASQDNFQLFNGNRFVSQEVNLSESPDPDLLPEQEPEAADNGSASLTLSEVPDTVSDFGFRSLRKPLGLPGLGVDAQRPARSSEAAAIERERRPKVLFNPRMVKNAKIRTLVRLDLQDFCQAKKKQSLRRMLVHLLGCFEGLLLDHVIQDVESYDLDQKDVAEWDLRDLALRVFSGKLDSNQILVLDFLFEARGFLSAAEMFVSSRVLTKAMVQSAEGLTRWMISDLGYDRVQNADQSAESEAPKLWRGGRT